MKKISNYNHYTVHGWMSIELGLKGIDKEIYAIIYGFSQDGESCFYGSRTYLQEWTGYSLQTIDTCLRRLIDKGLIIKLGRQDGFNNHYVINPEPPKFLEGVSNSQVEPPKFLEGGSQEIWHNNKNIYKDDNKEKTVINNSSKESSQNVIVTKRFVKPTIQEVANYIREKGYHFNPEAFIDFYESKGWYVGKTHMTNWRSACSTWERMYQEKHPNYGKSYSQQDFMEHTYQYTQPTPSYYGGAPRAERNFDERQYEPTDFKGLSVNIDDLDPNDV